MKKKSLISGLAALSVLAITAGATSALAASPNANSNLLPTRFKTHQSEKEGKKLTTEQKTTLKAKLAAVDSALAAGDYNAWVKAETEINAKAPILTKITSANFSQYVQAYNLRKQADAIMVSLGLEGKMGQGIGRGIGRGELNGNSQK